MYIDSAGFQKNAYNALARGFEACGKKVILLDITKKTFLQELESVLRTQNIIFSMGMNTNGLNLNTSDGKSLYSRINFPHIVTLTDVPYNMAVPRPNNIECNKLILCFLDKTHLQCLNYEKYKGNVIAKVFMPWWGSVPVNESNIFLKKDIDVIHSATFYGSVV